jgi:hypothetical protein
MAAMAGLRQWGAPARYDCTITSQSVGVSTRPETDGMTHRATIESVSMAGTQCSDYEAWLQATSGTDHSVVGCRNSFEVTFARE